MDCSFKDMTITMQIASTLYIIPFHFEHERSQAIWLKEQWRSTQSIGVGSGTYGTNKYMARNMVRCVMVSYCFHVAKKKLLGDG